MVAVNEGLSNVRQELTKEEPNYEEALKQAEQVHKKWEELDDTMALYIEHTEIEKVTTAIISSKSFIEMKDNSQSVDSIDRCMYILDNIEQKEKSTIDNIF